MLTTLGLFLGGLCWGSFLNVIGYSLVEQITWKKRRSRCPQCKKLLAWYELVPVLSWFIQKGRCRSCKKPISYLYPLIELLTGIITVLSFYIIPGRFLLSYWLFFSALVITVRTDLEAYLVFDLATLALIPIAFILALLGLLPISLFQSITGALFGYLLLWALKTAFFLTTGKEGMGQGDLHVLALIGAYTGTLGAWLSLTIAAGLGTGAGILYALFTKKNITATRSLKIPFGPFLALAAIIVVLSKNYLTHAVAHLVGL